MKYPLVPLRIWCKTESNGLQKEKIPNLNRYCFQKLTLLFGISTIDRKLKEGALHIFAGTDQDLAFCKHRSSKIDWKYMDIFGKAESLRIKCSMSYKIPSFIMEIFLE